MSGLQTPGAIDLAHERRFALGGLEVRPSTRELVAGGQSEVLEPRVMQVLVALARVRGQVVSRDDLIQACWGGRAVGEDAINRCTQAIRKRAEAHGGFAVTTIPRVGYRLDESALPFAKPALAAPIKPSIAVMPFANLSGDPDQAYFAEGMIVEITNALSRFKSLLVIASSSTLIFNGKYIDAREAALQLGVRYLLEGSVRRAGSRLRINVQLVDGSDGAQIWCERFESALDDVFALQDSVALAVAGRIEPTVQSVEVRRGASQPTTNLGAYDLYLRASALFHAFVGGRHLEALDLLNRAIALDPDFGQALALAAFCHRQILTSGSPGDAEDHRRQALSLAERALKAATDDAEVLVTVAAVRALLGEDGDGACDLADRAIALNPGSAAVWTLSGVTRLAAWRPEAAFEHAQEAIRLNPTGRTGQIGTMGQVRFWQGLYDEAAGLLGEAVQEAEYPYWHALFASCLGHLGKTREAQLALARCRALSPQALEEMARENISTRSGRQLFLDGIAAAEGTAPAANPE